MMSFGSGQAYRRDALKRAGLRPGMRVLDVATGTGLMAREASAVVGPSGRVVGVDPSAGMLREARRLDYRTIRGFGEALPVRGQSFDFLCMGYALRHLQDLQMAFEDYRRALVPGGRLVILEITQPDSPWAAWLTRIYFQRAVPLMARLVTGSSESQELMRYYWDTIVEFVPPARVREALLNSGFLDVRQRVVHGIFTEYLGRNGPVLDGPHHEGRVVPPECQ